MHANFLQQLKNLEILPHSRQMPRVFPGKKEVKLKTDAVTFGLRQPGNQFP